MVDFEICFGSLSCWNTQALFNFNVWTDLRTSASRISLCLVESILPSTRTIFPVPPAATTGVKLARTFVKTPKLAIALSQNCRLPRDLGDTFAHVTDVSIKNKSTLVVNS